MQFFSMLLFFAGLSLATKTVKTGLEVLIENNYTQLVGQKVIVLTNPTGVTIDLNLGLDIMFNSGAVDLVGVMGPEHGFRGTAQAGGSEGTFIDPETGLTVYVGPSITWLSEVTILIACSFRMHITSIPALS